MTEQIERKLITGLIDHMTEAGWHLTIVDDGEERFWDQSTEEALATIFSVDDSVMMFDKHQHKRQRVWLVRGNSGYDAIADYTCGDADFNAVMEGPVAELEELLECEARGIEPPKKPNEDQFFGLVLELAQDYGVVGLLRIPGVWELVAEEFKVQALDLWAERQEVLT